MSTQGHIEVKHPDKIKAGKHFTFICKHTDNKNTIYQTEKS